jgi:hypothetical protein
MAAAGGGDLDRQRPRLTFIAKEDLANGELPGLLMS